MNDAFEDESVCGADGCSTGPARLLPNNREPRQVHELTVVSDVICPWCFIAKRNLDRALESTRGDLVVKITWRPFELNPGMPKEGVDRRDYRSQKFGSWEYSQRLDMQVAAAGELAGIAFRHDLMKRTPNTFNAHRLIWLAEEEGVQDALVEALFRAYFIEGRDVGDRRELADIARQVDLSQGLVVPFLEGTNGIKEVRAQEDNAKMSGISSVPTFILNGVKLFSGALKPEQMAARLQDAVRVRAEG